MDGATLITGADGGLNQASSYADDTKTVALTAKWNAKEITITYDTVEANAVITSNKQTVRYDEINVQLLIPQLLDKGFDGWLLNGVEFTDASAILDKVDFVDNITLTAKWGDRVANFTYNTEAGVSGLPTTPVRVELGETVTLAIPVKEGHTFKGWYLNGVLFDFNGTMIFDTDIHRAVWHKFMPSLTGKPINDAEIDKYIIGRGNTYIFTSYIPGISTELVEKSIKSPFFQSSSRVELYKKLNPSCVVISFCAPLLYALLFLDNVCSSECARSPPSSYTSNLNAGFPV